MNRTKISILEAICLICIASLSNLLLSGPKRIIKNSGSASILNVLYISLLAFAIVYIVYLLFKKFTNSDILDVCGFLAGNWLKISIGILTVIFLISYASMNYRDIAENLKIIYFQNIDISYLLLLLILPIAIVNLLDFKTVVKCCLIIVPLILFSIFLVFILNTSNFTYQRMFPIFGNGIKSTFADGSQNIIIFIGLAYLFFLMPLLRKKEDYKKIAFSSIGISSFAILLATSCLLFTLPISTASEESMPIYLATKQISLGNYVERADILFLIIWILTIFSNLSISIAFVLEIIKKITNIQDNKPLVLPLCSILYGIGLCYKNISQLNLAKDSIFKNGFLILVLGLNIIILILANIKLKFQEKNKSLEGGA